MPFEIAFPFYGSKIQWHVNQIFIMSIHIFLTESILVLRNIISIPQRSYQFGIWNDFEMSLKIQKIQLQQNSKDFDAELKIKNKKIIFLWVRMRRYISFMPHYITCNIISIVSPLLVDVVINSCVFPTLISKTKLINRLVQG